MASFGDEDEFGKLRQTPSIGKQGGQADSIIDQIEKKIHASQALVDGYASLDRVEAAIIESKGDQSHAIDVQKGQEDHEVRIFDDAIRSSAEERRFQAMKFNQNSSEEPVSIAYHDLQAS